MNQRDLHDIMLDVLGIMRDIHDRIAALEHQTGINDYALEQDSWRFYRQTDGLKDELQRLREKS